MIRTPLGILGINSTRKSSFNCKNLVVLFLLGQLILSTTAYFLHEAKTTQEYSESFYTLNTSALLFFVFAVIIRKQTNIFQFIVDLRSLIETRELKIPARNEHLESVE